MHGRCCSCDLYLASVDVVKDEEELVLCLEGVVHGYEEGMADATHKDVALRHDVFLLSLSYDVSLA